MNITRVTWLAPFSGAKTVCVKCGSEKSQSEWHDTIVFGHICESRFREALMTADTSMEFDEAVTSESTEHLCRVCILCAYAWCEETADAGVA